MKDWKRMEMARKGRKWLDMVEQFLKYWKGLEISLNGFEWITIAGNG